MYKYLISIFLVLLLSGTVDAKKKLYKWVDENGNVSYSDQVSPDQIKKKHEELNDQGVVVDKIRNARTKEEILADKKVEKLEKEKQERKQALEKQRQNIIKAYTNESEINRLKDERLAALERNIVLATESLDFQKNSREQLMSMAADNERSGVEISKALKSRIVIVEEKIEYQMKFIKVKKSEITKVKQKFADDITIYREATQGR